MEGYPEGQGDEGDDEQIEDAKVVIDEVDGLVGTLGGCRGGWLLDVHNRAQTLGDALAVLAGGLPYVGQGGHTG